MGEAGVGVGCPRGISSGGAPSVGGRGHWCGTYDDPGKGCCVQHRRCGRPGYMALRPIQAVLASTPSHAHTPYAPSSPPPHSPPPPPPPQVTPPKKFPTHTWRELDPRGSFVVQVGQGGQRAQRG